MNRHAEIVFALLGQKFAYDAPEGRASGTPTVQVFSTGTDDDGVAETAVTGSCSVDAVNTTLASSAGMGETTLVVTSAASITKGRRYLLTDTDLNEEWLEVVTISGTTIGIRQPLLHDYASGSTFVGTRITADVHPTWVADRSKITDVLGYVINTSETAPAWAPGASGYRLRWSYTVASVATIGVSYADLVRYQAKNLITPLDVDNVFPGWIDSLGQDSRVDQGRALIDEAFLAVKMDALGDGQLLRRIRDTQVLAELVKYRANVLLVQNHVMRGGTDPAVLKVAEGAYEKRYRQLLREPKIPVDQTGGGSNGEAKRTPPWRR